MKPSSDLHLEPHRFRDEPAERGTLRVPVRHAHPGGASLTLPFVRLRARGVATAPPLVFLTGGPGLSGIRAGEGRLYPMFNAMRARGDVILFDQRACLPGIDLPSAAPPSFRRDAPVSRDEYLGAICETVRRAAATLADRGISCDALNSKESADDVALLARSLYGVGARIALLGWSYGSHLAMAIIRRHESLVARAVLAAPEGPDHTLKRPLRIQEHLERLAARARPSFDMAGSLTRALARLERAPAYVAPPVDAVIGRFDLEWIVSEGLADPRVLRGLPACLTRMERGDFDMIAREKLLHGAWRALREELPYAIARYCMDCASGASPERRAVIEREARDTLLGNTIDFPLPEICTAVGCPDLGDDFRKPITSDVPVLFVTGTLDCRTPEANVDELAPGFRSHRRLVVEDTGHGDLLLAAGVQVAIARYVATGDVDTERAAAATPLVFE
jgi:pimeloyl-ACP methyl ester carboxylesterase